MKKRKLITPLDPKEMESPPNGDKKKRRNWGMEQGSKGAFLSTKKTRERGKESCKFCKTKTKEGKRH